MWEKIEYREFWDVPRLFIVRHNEMIYLFNSKFDAERDDYPDFYKVYLLKESDVESKNWEEKISEGSPFLGEIQIRDIKFDVTRRKDIDGEIFSRFN
jgi:hypothetical protein